MENNNPTRDYDEYDESEKIEEVERLVEQFRTAEHKAEERGQTPFNVVWKENVYWFFIRRDSGGPYDTWCNSFD